MSFIQVKNRCQHILLSICAFVITAELPSWAGPLTDAEQKSKTYTDKLSQGSGGAGFEINGVLWSVIGVMLIMGIAIKVGFATMDGMGSQKTWRDHLWDVLGAGAPVIFGILFMGLLINWVAS
jgi:hypothetical protein